MHRMVSWSSAVLGLAILGVAPGHSRAANLTTLYIFCAFNNTCADGFEPHGLTFDTDGNLFGTTGGGGTYGGGTVFEIVKTAADYATTPTTLVSFCVLPNCADGAYVFTSLVADTNGNLFGTTGGGGAYGRGTAFEIIKRAAGYATTPTTLVSFCALADCANGAEPSAGLIADAAGNLFGTTTSGGPHGGGTVFEITGSGFVVSPAFAGTPGKPNCHNKSVSVLAQQ